jgi:hypothetical protein
VRFLRVDEKLKVTEKDDGAGYVLFELVEGKRTFPGAAELTRVTDSAGRAAIRATVRLEDRPSYMELGILERFAQKLREELGEPPPPPPPAAPAQPVAPVAPPTQGAPDAPAEERRP